MAEVIVALDVATELEALHLADSMPSLGWAKVGPTLFLRSGPAIVRELKSRGVQVFLDLKWHDIPHQVAGAVAAAEELDVDLATVHAAGGIEMLRAAAAASGFMRLAAVSVLTSHTPESYGEATGRGTVDLDEEVSRLAKLAMAAGVHGVVTSPREVGAMRSLVGAETWLVVPGIRPAGSDMGDQRRTADPRAAVEAGATHIVVGRPITRSEQPEAVYNQICAEIA
ncbi:MAG: orotidine-5'-phosphate decarboxylase [Gemmatimonadetes bacterium]|nr:orotidine-5'-phosphate decarboxylase [Gemmatimonadota bacterium]